MEGEGYSTVRVELIERAGTNAENRVVKEIVYDDPDLVLDEHVIPTFVTALKGFGFMMDGSTLAVVKEEEN